MARERQPDLSEIQRDTWEIAEKYNASRYGFISTEVDLGITFCEIAASTTDPEKTERNLAHAEQAQQAAKHFLKQGKLDRSMQRELQEKINRLEKLLSGLRGR